MSTTQEEKGKRDPNVSEKPKSSRTEQKQSTQQQQVISQQEQGDMTETPISIGSAILCNITIQIAQPQLPSQPPVSNTATQSGTMRDSGEFFSV